VPVPANERSSITSDKPSADQIILIAGKILNLRSVVISSAGPILHGNINISMKDVLWLRTISKLPKLIGKG
jgi:hypothetical protein